MVQWVKRISLYFILHGRGHHYHLISYADVFGNFSYAKANVCELRHACNQQPMLVNGKN